MGTSSSAKQTLAVIERGGYTSPSGREVSLRTEIDAAIAGTCLYRPGDFDALAARDARATAAPPRIEVTAETTAEAGRRLVHGEREAHVVALNFASAKNPGGGFLGGAKAQEEDLARCSALYRCLTTQRVYYDENRAHPSLLYTDHIIYSPAVPFFRDERLQLLDEPFLLSIITSPAPNAGEHLRRNPQAHDEIRATLESRARKVLAVAAAHGHRCLVLGAWGCGVFRNDPVVVAEAFAGALAEPWLAGAFDRVVFGVHDRAGHNFRAFSQRFG
jgi:uncharacterized protein (TIGR02452 family)